VNFKKLGTRKISVTTSNFLAIDTWSTNGMPSWIEKWCYICELFWEKWFSKKNKYWKIMHCHWWNVFDDMCRMGQG